MIDLKSSIQTCLGAFIILLATSACGTDGREPPPPSQEDLLLTAASHVETLLGEVEGPVRLDPEGFPVPESLSAFAIAIKAIPEKASISCTVEEGCVSSPYTGALVEISDLQTEGNQGSLLVTVYKFPEQGGRGVYKVSERVYLQRDASKWEVMRIRRMSES